MNKRERYILGLLQRECGERKSEHPSLYGVWWVLTELLHGRLGTAGRLARMGQRFTELRPES